MILNLLADLQSIPVREIARTELTRRCLYQKPVSTNIKIV